MTNRKFHRTIIRMEVLSEETYSADSIEQVTEDCLEGDCSGDWEVVEQTILNGKECAEALLRQGSDPSFFSLTVDGDDIEEED